MVDRYSWLPFFIKKEILKWKWKLQGTYAANRYKIEFWNIKRHVPYSLIEDYLKIQASELFNVLFYLSEYQDVEKDKADPILHYILHGVHEGRDPSLLFSTNQYFNYYPDVRKAGANPLLHFLYKGQSEGRRIFPVRKEENYFPYPADSRILPLPVAGHPEHPVLAVNESGPASVVKHEPDEPDFFRRGKPVRLKREVTKIGKVAFIAQPEYFEFHYINVLEELYEVRYFQNSFSEEPAFFQSLVEFDADINVFFRGEIVPEVVLASLTGIRVNLSSEPFPKIINGQLLYTEDSLERFTHFVRIFERSYDYIFHYDQVSKGFMELQGMKLSGYFGFPIVTEVIRPGKSPKKWDFFFSGRSTPHRDDFLGPLKRDFNFLHINHGVVGEDLLEFVHKCKVSINIHAENEISWEPRTQFMLAAGSLLVSEPLSPDCPLRPGIDFIEVRDPWSMYNVCRDIVQNFDKYKHIAESGRRRVQEVLSSRKIFPAFFDDIIAGKYEPASFNRARFKITPMKTHLKYNGFEHLLTEYLTEHA